jgi:REP element-mobilizing transposase RayT
MTKFQNFFRIESARLPAWDYSNPWWYYITICTKNHIEHFGKIENNCVELNFVGIIVEECWQNIPLHFPNVQLDYFVIMPNHIHGIVILEEKSRDVACNVSTNKMSVISPKKGSLSTVIRSFKSATTRRIRESNIQDFNWQTRFYDRIIRNEKELFNIRKYSNKIL